MLNQAWGYFLTHQGEFWSKTGIYLQLSTIALVAGLLIGAGLGILAAHSRAAGPVITNLVGILRSLPSLAIMAVMLPLIGVGFEPAAVALTILAIPPILINTEAGISGLDQAVLEAARGMGLGRLQIIWQVQLPLAAPVIVTGLRTAAVEVLSSATIGAIIGAGGLGEYIFGGLSLGPAYIYLMLVGAAAVALLTLTAEAVLNVLEGVARRRFYR